MLMFHKSQLIEGVTVYDDHVAMHRFYALPNTPRFRMDPSTKKPVFKFLKYRNPITREGGKKGGGFIIFDVEFVVPEDTLKKVTDQLQQQLNQKWRAMNLAGTPPKAEIAALPVMRSAATVQILDSGGALVEKVRNPAGPSNYGNFITPITVELSPEGATLAEQALQGHGGIVQVAYDLYTTVRLPNVKAHVWFYAEKFYQFSQTVNIEWRRWGEDDYRETISEQLHQSDCGGVDINFGAVTDAKVQNAIRDWAWSTIDEAAKRMVVGDIAPVTADERKVPDGIENLYRNVSVQKSASFNRNYEEGVPMEWNPAPRGTLPNITTIPGVKWQDYAVTVDLDDPFFKQLNVAMQVNADFQRLPLHSIEIHIEYPKPGGKKEVGEYRFSSPNDIAKFAAYIDNDNWNYNYWYQVNYKGASKVYKSPVVQTDEPVLTVNVDDVGVLTFDIKTGDLDFDQVKAAQLTVRYEDKEHGVSLTEKQFIIDKDHQEHNFTQMIFQPQTKPYQYRVKYIMKDGKEFQGDWVSAWANPLVVNDVWNAMKTVGVRGSGLTDKVDGIYLDLKYVDSVNKYTQTKSMALNKDNAVIDWTFPVISETGGKVFYSGTIKYMDGSEEAIPETEATKDTILVGPKILGFLEVEVLPDLIDWSLVKLAKISLQYLDAANGLNIKKDVIFKPDTTNPFEWKVELKDKAKTQYQWQATFFMTDGSQKKTALLTSEEPSLLPEVPQ